MTTIGLIGYGRTGKIIAEELLKEKDIQLKWILRRSKTDEGEFAGELLGLHKQEGKIFSLENLDVKRFFEENPVDIIVDFSNHSTINVYHEHLKHTNMGVISAISNYPVQELQLIQSLAETNPVLYSPNITLGINFLIVISEVLQQIAPWADIEIIEEHFRNKPDISGTALRIANILNLDTDKQVNSIRIGGIVGKHEVIFGLPNQTIRLTHETNNRAAFGQGIIFGIKYLTGMPAGMYTMDKIIKEKFANSFAQN